jgi:RimJ/RimL family protein N-acetyltransferase
MDLSDWKGVPRPERAPLEGRYARLEPLDPARHGDDLFASAQQPGADSRFRYLADHAPADRAAFTAWIEKASASTDPLFFAVIDKRTGRAEGRQSFMRIEPAHGVIEIGHILWGPAIARTRVATEALYLFASHAFDTLGYRRFEWKCDNNNLPSKRAAERFGFTFEGVFRQHIVVKGRNRDTAWFAIIDRDWPRLKAGYEAWLHQENFDEAGQQKHKLTF